MIEICAAAQTVSLRDWLARYRGCKPLFACILSATETGLMPDISAAGTTPQARRYTAIADGEFLFSGRASTRHPFPRLPGGISPVVITRAVLSHQQIPLRLLSTGLFDSLCVPHVALPRVIAKAVNTARAMTPSQVNALLESGLKWGRRLAQPGSYLILGECVVGGTTTAQAVLTALGYPVAQKMSSSHQHNNHRQKQAVVDQGLALWQHQANRCALSAVAAVGDPMQAVAAGIAITASRRGGVLLAGGSQMLAVYALVQAVARERSLQWDPSQVVVGTTRWVIEDANAETAAIAKAVGAPYLASQINFTQSPYFQLRAYEQGFVKEGTGAGGCAIASNLYQGWTNAQLRHAVEAQLRLCL
ncbi:MAG: TIGR00303 family protein [Phormidesmis sp.]